MNLFGNCSGKNPGNGLKWINPPSEWDFSSKNILNINAPAGSDYFQDPAGIHIRGSAPFLYKEIKGDFVITTRLEAEMKSEYDSGCLMLMSNDTNWAKLCFEFSNRVPIIVSVVTRDYSDDCNSEKVEVKSPYLRADRLKNCFSFHYSNDGKNWKLIRYFGMNAGNEIKAGVVAQSPSGQGCRVSFDFLEYENRSPVNLRIAD
jgi:uncharacterized protein